MRRRAILIASAATLVSVAVVITVVVLVMYPHKDRCRDQFIALYGQEHGACLHQAMSDNMSPSHFRAVCDIISNCSGQIKKMWDADDPTALCCANPYLRWDDTYDLQWDNEMARVRAQCGLQGPATATGLYGVFARPLNRSPQSSHPPR